MPVVYKSFVNINIFVKILYCQDRPQLKNVYFIIEHAICTYAECLEIG